MLRHDGVAVPHFDLLFEWEPGEPLTSFRCPAWLPSPGDEWEERPDHRRAYLDYEGPIAGDRGSVRRVAAGAVAIDVTSVDPPSVGLVFDRTFAVVVTHEIARGRWRVVSASA